MNKEELSTATVLLFFLAIGFIILGCFGCWGDEIKSIMLILMSILAIGMVGVVCYKAIIKG